MPPSEEALRISAQLSIALTPPHEAFEASMRALDRLVWTADRPHRMGWWIIRVGPDEPFVVWFNPDDPERTHLLNEDGVLDELPAAWGWNWSCLALALV